MREVRRSSRARGGASAARGSRWTRVPWSVSSRSTAWTFSSSPTPTKTNSTIEGKTMSEALLVELDDLLVKRDEINQQLQQIIDELTNPWGIKVTLVEVKDVELPETMRRAMARQAEAERERRSKVIHAKGEFEAAETLSQAGEVLERRPGAMQLRMLSTMTEVAAEKTSTLIFPIPIELLRFAAAAANPAPEGDGVQPGGPSR